MTTRMRTVFIHRQWVGRDTSVTLEAAGPAEFVALPPGGCRLLLLPHALYCVPASAGSCAMP